MIYLIFLLSIIFHEFSHILVGILLGYKVKSFCIVPLGTSIEFEDDCNKKFLKNIIIYIAGPLSNFFISFIIYISKIKYKDLIFYTNIILGIFNLFPINPLDGGKIIKEILLIIFKNKRANIYFYYINKFFLCMLTFVYSIAIIKIKNISLVVILGYLWYLDIKENRKVNTLKRVYSIIEKSNF